MAKSILTDKVILSPNHSGKRTHNVDRITPHCVVGQLSAESLGNCFKSTSRKASCNYGISKDGKVILVVDEDNRSWCSSSNSNDQRAITIECASDNIHPYTMNNVVYSKLVDLCVDVCKRYNKTKLLWISDKNKALAYKPKQDEMLITVHRWFANKACPGDWLFNKLSDLADKVTSRLNNTVFNNKVELSTSETSDFLIKVDTDTLNIRSKSNATSNIVGSIKRGEVYTIVKVENDWGKLKSGVGWINLKYTKRV